MLEEEIYNNLMFVNFGAEELDRRIKAVTLLDSDLADQVNYIINQCDLLDREGAIELSCTTRAIWMAMGERI